MTRNSHNRKASMKLLTALAALVVAMLLPASAQATQITWSVNGCAGAASDVYQDNATHVQLQTSIFGDVSTGICQDGNTFTLWSDVVTKVLYCKVGSDSICDDGGPFVLESSADVPYHNGAQTFWQAEIRPTLVSASVFYGYFTFVSLDTYNPGCGCVNSQNMQQSSPSLRVKLKP